MAITTHEFMALALQNPANVSILARLKTLALPQAFLTAGCLFQSVWNLSSNRPVAADINDYDIFYYDAGDLSWEAEDRVIRAVEILCRDLGVTIEVKNQARVHLWYEQRFAMACPPLMNARQGIDRFPCAGTCVGIDIATGDFYAPFGVQDIYDGILRMNANNARPELFLAKAQAYQRRWPWLQISMEPAVSASPSR